MRVNKKLQRFILIFILTLFYIPNSYADVEIWMPDILNGREPLKTEINAYQQKLKKVLEENTFSNENLPIWNYNKVCEYGVLSNYREKNPDKTWQEARLDRIQEVVRCRSNERISLDRLRKNRVVNDFINFCARRQLEGTELSYQKMLSCAERQHEAKKKMETGIAGYTEVMSRICLANWDGNYSRALYCIEEQVQAKKNAESGEYQPSKEVKKKCDTLWNGDYTRYFYCITNNGDISNYQLITEDN